MKLCMDIPKWISVMRHFSTHKALLRKKLNLFYSFITLKFSAAGKLVILFPTFHLNESKLSGQCLLDDKHVQSDENLQCSRCKSGRCTSAPCVLQRRCLAEKSSNRAKIVFIYCKQSTKNTHTTIKQKLLHVPTLVVLAVCDANTLNG